MILFLLGVHERAIVEVAAEVRLAKATAVIIVQRAEQVGLANIASRVEAEVRRIADQADRGVEAIPEAELVPTVVLALGVAPVVEAVHIPGALAEANRTPVVEVPAVVTQPPVTPVGLEEHGQGHHLFHVDEDHQAF